MCVLSHETHPERHKNKNQEYEAFWEGKTRIKLATFNNFFLSFFILIWIWENIWCLKGSYSCQTIITMNSVFVHFTCQRHKIIPPVLANGMNFDLKWVMGQFKQSTKCEMISNFHAYDITRFYFSQSAHNGIFLS